MQVAISLTSDHPQGEGHGACGVGVTPHRHRSRSLLPTHPQLSSSISTPEPLVPPKYLQVTVAADAAPSLPYSPRSQHEGPTAPHSSWISCKSTVWTPSLASDAFSTWPGVAGLDAWLIRILPGRRGYPSSIRDRCFEHFGTVFSFGCPLVLACTDVLWRPKPDDRLASPFDAAVFPGPRLLHGDVRADRCQSSTRQEMLAVVALIDVGQNHFSTIAKPPRPVAAKADGEAPQGSTPSQ
ncbi:hypothetical protein IWX50DRAFT_161025 [Phyllosticta citricarpa]|uniref:Uncharacterized protein n=1 Tax=Phyllosticta citricarpa TaxID=55181 RepID=A0ABR1MFM4_9PEZI